MRRQLAALVAITWASFGCSCAAVIGIEDGHPRARTGGAGGTGASAGQAGSGGGAGAFGGATGGNDASTGGASGASTGGASGASTGGASGAAGALPFGGGSGQGGDTSTSKGGEGGSELGGQAGTAGVGGASGGAAGSALVGYGVPPSGVKVRLLASTGDDPVASLATDAASSLVVTGRLGGAMPVGLPNDLAPEASGQTAYVLRYTQSDQLAFAARLHAPKLLTRRVITGPDGSIYVLGEAEGALTVLDAPSLQPGASPTAAFRGPFVLRFDPLGRLAWIFRPVASPGQRLELASLALDASAEGLLVAGSFDGTIAFDPPAATATSNGSVDIVIIRLGATTGVVERTRVLGTAGPDENARLAEAPGGNRLAFTCAGAFTQPGANELPDCAGIATIALDATLTASDATSFDVSGPDQLVFARSLGGGFFVGARYAGTATLPPLPPLPTGPGRFLVARLDEAGAPLQARTLPEPGVLSLEIVTADLDGGVLLGGSGRGCLSGDTGGQICSTPANAQNGLVVRLDAQLGLQWAVFQTASSGAPRGIVKGIALCPNGELLGASSFDTGVTVLKQKVPWKGGTDTVIGRFFH